MTRLSTRTGEAMIRAFLLVLGWLAAAFCLWALLVVLEVYWNLYNWQPEFDLSALGAALGVCLALVSLLLLARAGGRGAVRGVALVVCLTLLVLAVYVAPPEPLTSGLFARERSSPNWYRVSRFCVLALPTVFWFFGRLRRVGQ